MSEMVRDSCSEVKKERALLRREGTWPRAEGIESRRHGAAINSAGPVRRETMMEVDGQRVKGVGQESQGCEGAEIKEKDVTDEGHQHQDKKAGWWYQLMQSSQVYIEQSAEGSKFVKIEKRKKSSERRHGQPPPTREGVVEGAESSQIEEGYRSRGNSSSSSTESTGSRVRPSWMGSPPESIINQEKEIKPLKVSENRYHKEPGRKPLEENPCHKDPAPVQSLRWGRLFGAGVGSSLRVEGPEQKTKSSTTR